MRKLILFALVIIVGLSSCGILIHRKVKCKDFELTSERFWFQGYMLTPYTFINKSTGERKLFYIKDKLISHRNSYFSDTGCSCYDMSAQLLMSENDSLWIVNESMYIEHNQPKTNETFTFVINGQRSIINAKFSIVEFGFITVNGTTIKTKKVSRDFYGEYNEVVLGELIGIISFNLKNEVWERQDLKVEKLAPIFDYRILIDHCY
jgi:hypothetical protein